MILALSSFHTMLRQGASDFWFKKMLYLKMDTYLRAKMFNIVIYQCSSQGFPAVTSVQEEKNLF